MNKENNFKNIDIDKFVDELTGKSNDSKEIKKFIEAYENEYKK